MRRRIIILFTLLAIAMSSCTQATEQNNSTNTVQTESDMWSVEILSSETTESLTTTIAAIQYNGDLQETENQIYPQSGNEFLLLNLTIEKIGTGKAAFSWSDAHIEDNNGNLFYRMENDTFLANLNIPRLKGTDIVLGTETGFVCFEIPKGSSGLSFVSDEGNIIIELGI